MKKPRLIYKKKVQFTDKPSLSIQMVQFFVILRYGYMYRGLLVAMEMCSSFIMNHACLRIFCIGTKVMMDDKNCKVDIPLTRNTDPHDTGIFLFMHISISISITRASSHLHPLSTI